MLKLFYIFLFKLLLISTSLFAQEIDFGSYSNRYTMSVSELNPSENLDFGMLIVNEGTKEIPLIDAKVLALEGVKYLDVMLEIQADNSLLLDGVGCDNIESCSLPFTLQAAYANRGVNDISQATFINVDANNFAVAQFPILHRGNHPPGPPPTPTYEGYNPALYHETAYIFLYGSVNVGNIDAGNYSADITITVHYD